MTTNDPLRDLFTKYTKAYAFAQWVADEIFDEDWENNKDAFAEIACRKLEKLGLVRQEGNEWIKENSDAEHD